MDNEMLCDYYNHDLCWQLSGTLLIFGLSATPKFYTARNQPLGELVVEPLPVVEAPKVVEVF